MYTATTQRQIFLSLIAVLALVVMVSCSDDVAEPDVPSGMGSGTPPGDFGVPTPDPDAGGERDTPGVRLTPQVTPEMNNATPDGEDLPEPQVTGTPLALAERTVTPGESTTGPVGDIFPDVRTQGPDLENYTLTSVGEIVSTEEATQDQPTNVDLTIEQSTPGTFHLLFDAADEFVVEVWSVEDQMWIREEAGINEAPDEFAEAFDIGTYLSILPEVERISEAEEIGEEEIEGRTTTHYTVPAENAVQYLPSVDESQIQDPQGSIEIWLDETDNVILRMVVDLTWQDAEGGKNSNQSEYNVTSIGETDEIEVPAQ